MNKALVNAAEFKRDLLRTYIHSKLDETPAIEKVKYPKEKMIGKIVFSFSITGLVGIVRGEVIEDDLEKFVDSDFDDNAIKFDFLFSDFDTFSMNMSISQITEYWPAITELFLEKRIVVMEHNKISKGYAEELQTKITEAQKQYDKQMSAHKKTFDRSVMQAEIRKIVK